MNRDLNQRDSNMTTFQTINEYASTNNPLPKYKLKTRNLDPIAKTSLIKHAIPGSQYKGRNINKSVVTGRKRVVT